MLTLEEFRSIRWRSADGRVCKVGEIDDSHLINIIDHVLKAPWYKPQRREELLLYYHREAESRGLTIADLESATGTWVDPTDGKTKRFSIAKKESR